MKKDLFTFQELKRMFIDELEEDKQLWNNPYALLSEWVVDKNYDVVAETTPEMPQFEGTLEKLDKLTIKEGQDD